MLYHCSLLSLSAAATVSCQLNFVLIQFKHCCIFPMLPECKFGNCCKHCRFYRLCFSEGLEHRLGNVAVQLLFRLVLQFLELLQVVFSSGLFFCFLFYYHCKRGTFFKDNMSCYLFFSFHSGC